MYAPAISGDDALVPPTTPHALAPFVPSGPYVATPVCGSATADTSASVRFAQPVSDCQGGFGSNAEQPLLVSDHAVSDQPRALPSLVSVVPPTATTSGVAAGYCGPAGKAVP